MKRRIFIQHSGLLATGLSLRKISPVAGPFYKKEFSQSVAPINKKLDPVWVKSLYKRGSVTTYYKSRGELQYIGMPVGGIGCGNVYVGGDGRLWLWDIFNSNQLGAVHRELPIKLTMFDKNNINNIHGSLYVEPATQIRPFQQGIAIIVDYNGKKLIKQLQHDDWTEITFEATYPVATIQYADKDLPVEVIMQTFSPFIPGDEYHSGLPATIQSITVRNKSDAAIEIKLIGWIENKMLPYTGKVKPYFKRNNTVLTTDEHKGIFLECHSNEPSILNANDYGNMAFISPTPEVQQLSGLMTADNLKEDLACCIKENSDSPIGLLYRPMALPSGDETTTDFIITWYTPNLSFKAIDDKMRFYMNDFDSAKAVAVYIVKNYNRLKSDTLLWKKTWYDGTLPWWFLERTFLNVSILATTTCHRLKSGRFYAWEGIGCCAGTCTHVWQYAQGAARVFPALERDTRQRVDLGISLQPDGAIWFRGEADKRPAIDGQAGTILRIYREHQMSSDDTFLKSNWDKIKKAVQFVMAQDKNKDGMEDTPMENTLDAVWHGEISWIVGLCIASVAAAAQMAIEMNDQDFADACKQYVEAGRKNMEENLFNGEYFIHRPDPKEGKKGIGSYNTCHIDQVYGQSWAWQVGLGRILDKGKTRSALHALWKYNFMPDVGPYIKDHPGGRFYALSGDGGMVMNTNPKNEEKPYGEAEAWQIGYFSECMTGFEHQVASHMMAEGMIDESLILTKTIHDRYHASKRNPFNEIECSDHYARAMASYGTFINACGFTYHGPKGHIGFAPKLSPEDFKAPFIVAEGWGSYRQQRNESHFSAQFAMKHGTVKLRKITVELQEKHKVLKALVSSEGKNIPCSFYQQGTHCDITFTRPLEIMGSQVLDITL